MLDELLAAQAVHGINWTDGISWAAIVFAAGGCYWLLRHLEQRVKTMEREGSPHIKLLSHQIQTCATRLDQIERYGSPGVEVINTKIDQLRMDIARLTEQWSAMRIEMVERTDKNSEKFLAISERVAKLEP